MSELAIVTCAGSVTWEGTSTGRCCATNCGQPAPYAALIQERDVYREHLRCVEHAAVEREQPDLVAMKAVRTLAEDVAAGLHDQPHP